MGRFGIILDSKHSRRDFGMSMTARNIGIPNEIKVKVQVPFSNIVHDISYIYGGKVYGERTLNFEFSFEEHNKLRMEYRKNRFIAWLKSGYGKKRLVDDLTPEYHYFAECSDTSATYNTGICRITAVFTADPLRIPNNPDSGLEAVI